MDKDHAFTHELVIIRDGSTIDTAIWRDYFIEKKAKTIGRWFFAGGAFGCLILSINHHARSNREQKSQSGVGSMEVEVQPLSHSTANKLINRTKFQIQPYIETAYTKSKEKEIMGEKGDKQTGASAISAEKLQKKLRPLGNINLRKMFGGHGVFIDEKMFALVDKKGTIFFKADDSIIKMFNDAGSEKHGRMPYYQLPEKIFLDEKTLQTWAQSSINVAKKSN